MINKYLYILLLFSVFEAAGQDTDFVNRHIFPTPVRNVFQVDTLVYVKAGGGLYKMDAGKWVQEDIRFEKSFMFYDKGFYETDFIPNNYYFDAQVMAHLIPQRSLSYGTIAKSGNRLFVGVGGSLYEYSVNNNYKHYYKGNSIRDIYIEPALKVISTYSGIFLQDSIKVPEPGYSNGAFTKIQGKYFLSSDQLYQYTRDSGFRKIETGANEFAGHSRKLVAWKDLVFSQNSKSINTLDSNFVLKPVHQGYDYNDLEATDSLLLFCTSTGEVFQFNGLDTKLLVKLPARVRDIYLFKNTWYFASDAGVFTLINGQANSLVQLTKIPFCVNVIIDLMNNTWIATENGLYVIPNKSKEIVLFIADVEFNRGALKFYEDSIYAGSIEGLYVFNSYTVLKNFIPQYINKKKLDESDLKKKQLLFVLAIVTILLGFGFLFQRWRASRRVIAMPRKEESVLSAEKIAQDIRQHNIMTVEALAEFYKTNTVQLNRQFKTFETTPGKFMKEVKLDQARDLLSNGSTMEQVVAKVGYSAAYLKKHI